MTHLTASDLGTFTRSVGLRDTDGRRKRSFYHSGAGGSPYRPTAPGDPPQGPPWPPPNLRGVIGLRGVKGVQGVLVALNCE